MDTYFDSLMIAISNKNHTIISTLIPFAIKAGQFTDYRKSAVNIRIDDQNGYIEFHSKSLLHFAIDTGDIAIVSYFIGYGSLINLSYIVEKHPYQLRDDITSMWKFKTETAVIKEEFTPVDYALAQGKQDIANLLRFHGGKSKNYKDPMAWAQGVGATIKLQHEVENNLSTLVL